MNNCLTCKPLHKLEGNRCVLEPNLGEPHLTESLENIEIGLNQFKIVKLPEVVDEDGDKVSLFVTLNDNEPLPEFIS